MKDEKKKMTAKILAEENQNLVHFVCRRYFNKHPGQNDYEDAAGAGMVGLVKAANYFCPERGTAFSTYAVFFIVAEMQRHFRDYQSALGGIRIARSQKKLGVKASVSSLQSPVGAGKEDSTREVLLQDIIIEMPDFSVVDFDLFLNSLTERERLVCKLKLDGELQETIAKEIGIGQPQISRIISKIKEKYKKFEEEGL